MGKGEKQFAAISKAGRRLAGSIGAPISPAHFSFMAAGKTVSSRRSAFYYDVDGHLLDDLGSNSPLLQKATLSVGGFEQAVAVSGIQPCESASEQFHVQCSVFLLRGTGGSSPLSHILHVPKGGEKPLFPSR